MLLTSCISTHKAEKNEIIWPHFPDPILEDGTRIYKIPDYKEAMKFIYKEEGYVIIPEYVWNQYCVWESEVIIPEWYWLAQAYFVIDYESAISRLKILEGKNE